jgi:NADH:ubiquinone oxidoreductase subunit 2 (subunit N)
LLDKAKIKRDKAQWQFVNLVLPIIVVMLFGLVFNIFRKYRYAGKQRFNRKTVVNLVVFAILLIASILIVNNNRKNTIDLPVDAFQVKDTASIYKVFIADMKGKSVILTRQSGKWLVNNQ